MGILDSIVEWIATQVMNLLDMITGSVLGALGCDMSTFLRYFPAAETLYDVFVAIAIGFILLNLVWQLFKNFGLGIGLSAEDPVKLAIKSILFIFLALFADQIMVLILDIAGTPYDWIVGTALPSLDFASFGSVLTVIVGCIASGSVSLIVLILVIIIGYIIGDYEEKTTLLHSGLHIKYMKSSNRQQYLKQRGNRLVRKYYGLSGKGNRYRKVFDYWWELY